MDDQSDPFEAELQRVAPAPVPTELMDRLRAAQPLLQPLSPPRPQKVPGLLDFLFGLRWLMAATPVVVAAILLLWIESRPADPPRKLSPAAPSGMRANAIQVDRDLVSSFDAVAQLPGGEPVRFRCREWRDAVVIRDDSHGVVIERSNPRVEVIPVRFETY
jgi:hypothetical protein